jgi:hypothetical protein
MRLERAPTTASVHPFENQVTEVLGFIIDHDHRFACDLVELLWSAGTPERSFWPVEPASVGAFPGGTLPGAGLAPVLYPDLSICGAGPDFQVLVEVKVTADFHGYLDEQGATVLQPDAYARGWETVTDELPQERRRVSTIAPRPPRPAAAPHLMRGRDITWDADVIPLLLECASRRGPLDDVVGVTALDLASAVRSRLTPPPPPDRGDVSDELYALIDRWHEPFVEALHAFEEARPGRLRPGRVATASDYLGAYVTVETPHCEAPVRIWVFVTTADGKYNRDGQAASVCVCLWEPGPRQCPDLHRALRGPLAEPGARRADRAGETASRVYRPADSFDHRLMLQSQLVLWVDEVLVTSGIIEPVEEPGPRRVVPG